MVGGRAVGVGWAVVGVGRAVVCIAIAVMCRVGCVVGGSVVLVVAATGRNDFGHVNSLSVVVSATTLWPALLLRLGRFLLGKLQLPVPFRGLRGLGRFMQVVNVGLRFRPLDLP